LHGDLCSNFARDITNISQYSKNKKFIEKNYIITFLKKMAFTYFFYILITVSPFVKCNVKWCTKSHEEYVLYVCVAIATSYVLLKLETSKYLRYLQQKTEIRILKYVKLLCVYSWYFWKLFQKLINNSWSNYPILSKKLVTCIRLYTS
jgi:hypothetical protein